MSNSLRLHGMQHTRFLFPPLSPRVCSNACPLSQWCYLTICHTLLLCFQSIPASIIVFSNESAHCIKWPKYWSFNFSLNSLSDEYSGLVFFRTYWFDLPAVQGTLKNLLQHHNSKPSILWHSAFFIVQLSHSYMATGKTIACTRWNFVSEVMSLLFNMLSRFVITFLPKSSVF